MMCPCSGWGPPFGVGRRSYGPPWAWGAWGEDDPRFARPRAETAGAARKESLEVLKRRLEADLAEVNDELNRL